MAGRLQGLVDNAARFDGKGMNALASACWGTNDWLLARACIHEAGHAAIARAVGAQGVDIEIDRESIGSGFCKYRKSKSLTRRQLQMIGLAGTVADQLAEFGAVATGKFIHRVVSLGSLSEPDASHVGAVNEADITLCLSIVRSRWHAIAAECRHIFNLELAHHGQESIQ